MVSSLTFYVFPTFTLTFPAVAFINGFQFDFLCILVCNIYTNIPCSRFNQWFLVWLSTYSAHTQVFRHIHMPCVTFTNRPRGGVRVRVSESDIHIVVCCLWKRSISYIYLLYYLLSHIHIPITNCPILLYL
jgi:hypothetical protein